MPRIHKSMTVGSLLALAILIPSLLWLRHSGEAAQVRPKPPAVKTLGPAALQTARNLGKAYYEQGKYPEAAQEFRHVVASGHALATDYLDLGLALLQANQLDKALGALTTAKQMAPKLVAVDYNLGILYKRELRYPDAEAALRRVIEANPRDPAAWFNLGTVYFAQRKLEQALDAQLHVVRMGLGHGENFYVASLFHTFTILIRLQRRQEAQKYLKIHEQVRDKVPGISLQNPALEGGKYGAILVPTAPVTEVARVNTNEPIAFADLSPRLGFSLPSHSAPDEPPVTLSSSDYSLAVARQKIVPLFGPSLAIGDYDGDGRPDIYVVDPAGTNHLLHNNGDGTFTDVTAKAGISGPGEAVSATFADYTNSGHPSLFVAGLGGVRLYQNKGDGTFTDVTAKAGLKPAPGDLDTSAVLFDADHDGFLDLLVTAYTNLSSPPRQGSFRFPDDFSGAIVRFYHNNGDGTFTDATSAAGFSAARGRMRGAIFADFNNDGYMDTLLFRDDGPPLLYLNQTEGKFADRTREAGPALSDSHVLNAQVTDFNHDGNFDLALWTTSGYTALRNQGPARFEPFGGLPKIEPPAGLFSFRGALADAHGDSFTDFLVADKHGALHLVADRVGRFREERLNLPARSDGVLASLSPTWLANPAQLDLIGITRQGRLVAWRKQGPPAHWLEVKMDGYKSNKLGVGSIIEFKAGDFYKKVMVTGGPVRVYTGGLTKLDVVRATWPNAIVQNQMQVATDQSISIRESERLASSCPFLYAWNGKKFVFVTDVLGVGPLGELAPDGTRLRPYPEEFVRLPETVRERNGAYEFRLTDELREADYFDSLRLMAVDHPASEEIYSNEIYSSSPAEPRLYAIRHKQFPVAAVDSRGRNALPLLLKADGRYPADFRQSRIPGLSEPHSLTLDPGPLPSPKHVSLWLTGWVFWTDSNGSRVLMGNSKLRMINPYLQVRNAQGQWVTVISDIGLPSGANRTMRVDLTGKFLSTDHHVRIVTNLLVYWDRAFFSTEETPVSATAQLPLEAADLRYRGFSTPVSDPRHRKPDFYEYASLMKYAPWNPMSGPYTRYGNVDELLTKPDDRLVVLATGDEISVTFSARSLPPLPPGWKRDLFLDATGYAKDGEPNTAFSKTATPLPFRGMSNYPPAPGDHRPSSLAYRRYLEEYETRPGYALIPPLAPPLQ